MTKSSEKIDLEQEKWNKLEKYKCYICKEEFYFIKKEFEKEAQNGEFSEEPFSTLPIFLNEGKCPFCKSSKKQLIYIPSEEEVKKKKKEQEEKKKAEKEILRQKLEELKEEEARLDKLHEEQIEALCGEIFDDTMNYLKELENDLKSGKVGIDRFSDLLLDKAFQIIQVNTATYNRINKEISLVLSNSFKAGFRDAILDFVSAVRQKFRGMEEVLKEKEEALENISKDSKDYEAKKMDLEDDLEKSKDSEKEGLEDTIDDSKSSLGKDFKDFLRRETKIK